MPRINILTDADSWFSSYVDDLVQFCTDRGDSVRVAHELDEVVDADLTIMLSLTRMVPREVRDRARHTVGIHASALPEGRGWSPVTWQVIEGRNEIPLSLFEAEDGVDSGQVYLRSVMRLRGDELVDEIRAEQAAVVIQMCKDFLSDYPAILDRGEQQDDKKATYYRRRLPEDSRLDPEVGLCEQFDLLRTVDAERYPAFVELRGRRFRVRLDPL